VKSRINKQSLFSVGHPGIDEIFGSGVGFSEIP